MKTLGFCFLIYDTINLEEVWRLFFKNVDPNKYKIYIHYKTNKPLKYFEQYKIKNCIETKYADISLIYAHNLLFKQAYEDGCDKIISLSQACIPFKSFDYVYEFLTKDNFSHFNVSPHSQCFPRCNELLNYYYDDTIQKSSNWFILNRTCAKTVIDYPKDKIAQEYTNITSPEEHYFITLLHKYHMQDQIIATPNLTNDATTFINWDDMGYKYPSTYLLKNYDSISEEELHYLLNSKCLFGRKFNRECLASLYDDTYIRRIMSN